LSVLGDERRTVLRRRVRAHPDHRRHGARFEPGTLGRRPRRKWFYGLLAGKFLIDLVDTAIKGREHFISLGVEYPIRQLLLAGSLTCPDDCVAAVS
jgi:hypothetical protein